MLIEHGRLGLDRGVVVMSKAASLGFYTHSDSAPVLLKIYTLVEEQATVRSGRPPRGRAPCSPLSP